MRNFFSLMLLISLTGCGGMRSQVVDSEGVPVADAWMRLDPPSFNGPQIFANSKGVIKYRKPMFFEVAQVIVESPTKGSVLLPFPPPQEIILNGTRWENSIYLPKTQQGAPDSPQDSVIFQKSKRKEPLLLDNEK